MARHELAQNFDADGGLPLPHDRKIYFEPGTPADALGQDGDVSIDNNGVTYRKAGGNWSIADVDAPGVVVPTALRAATGADPVLELGVTGEAAFRLTVDAEGSLHWGDGTDPLWAFEPVPFGLKMKPEGSTNLVRLVVADNPFPAGGGAPQAYLRATPGMAWVAATNVNDWGGVFSYATSEGADTDPFYGLVKIYADVAMTDFTKHAVEIWHGGDGGPMLTVDYTGASYWGDGTGAPDVTLQRHAAGVLEIPEHGGGLRLTSPDGTKTKTLTIDNTGALALL